MDDSDLQFNFDNYRCFYYLNLGRPLLRAAVRFEDFPDPTPMREPKGGPCEAIYVWNDGSPIIAVRPHLATCYTAAKVAILHETAHLAIDCQYGFGSRYQGHGKTFYAEIDRLYQLGAYKKLL